MKKNLVFPYREAKKVIIWFSKNQRDLPWRRTYSPYHIWLSEIMLQQTRVEAVISSFQQFLHVLPTVHDLSVVDDDALMKLWEGMGYYTRARNLKKAAQQIMQEYNGILPHTTEELVHLPGIGSYTAGAIASIAYGECVPAVDGNVLRVLARYFGIKDDIRNPKTKEAIEQILEILYQTKQSKLQGENVRYLNQGFMEIGALVCVPNGKPKCTACPLKKNCYAYTHHKTASLPYRSSLKQRTMVERTLFIIRDGSSFLIQKRPNHGLLAGLYEFIGTDAYVTKKEAIQIMQSYGFDVLQIKTLPQAKHIFSHVEWHMHAYEIRIGNDHTKTIDKMQFVTKKELRSLAIPSAFKTYIEYYDL